MVLPIRFGLPTTKLYNNGIATHSLVGYKYIEKILEAGLFVRGLPLQGMVYGLLNEDADWIKIRSVFLDDRPIGDKFINVVCGFDDIFTHNWVAGQVNVAITVSWPRPPRTHVIEALKAWYDYICCPNTGDILPLKDAGLNNVKQLPINVSRIKGFFDMFEPDTKEHQRRCSRYHDDDWNSGTQANYMNTYLRRPPCTCEEAD